MTFRIPASSRARLRDRLVVASVSGGKDSTALALLLREAEIPHVRVFADTGFEHPTTYEYLDLLRERLGEITTVRNELLWQDALPGEPGMLTLIRRKQMFPEPSAPLLHRIAQAPPDQKIPRTSRGGEGTPCQRRRCTSR
ncbi:MAG: phosphoadenosine phosphosulfate reductase family protein [Nannocystis sp.]|nr:phosphoadenosine phosphosulfate reductase family protein [Nannocystis sp.]